MTDNEPSYLHRQFFKSFIKLIARLTGIPTGLYEIHEGRAEALIPEASRLNYQEHCRLLQSFPEGRVRCEADQAARAISAFKSDQLNVRQCCWAGVYSEAAPIRIGGKTVGVLTYGQMRGDDEEHMSQSLAKHREAVSSLGLTESQATELRKALEKVHTYSRQDLSVIRDLLSEAEQWMDIVLREEGRARYELERSTHEINTRLQSVIAHAENMVLQVESADFTAAKKTAESILQSAESLDTVVQTLGDFLEDYRFVRQPLGPIIDEAVSIYGAEASRRGLELVQRLAGSENPLHWVDVSRRHLQLALNNLVHNAIKYSYLPVATHRRFVSIEGHPEKNCYVLRISNYGVGISPDEYDRIFLIGYRGRLTRGEYRTGSGRGLSFVKRALEAHHGTIEVVSHQQAPDGGPHVTKFTVRLPYYQPGGSQ